MANILASHQNQQYNLLFRQGHELGHCPHVCHV